MRVGSALFASIQRKPQVRPRRNDRTERESASASGRKAVSGTVAAARSQERLFFHLLLAPRARPLYSLALVHPFFLAPSDETAMVSFLLKGCAFLYLLIHKIRLYLGKRWPLSASIKSS